MEKGKIVNVKYNKYGNIIYKIKLCNNTRLDSIEYSKHGDRLNKNDDVEIEVNTDGKAKILDNNLTRVESRKMQIKDYAKILSILLIFSLIGFLKMMDIISTGILFLFLILLMISGWLKALIWGYLIHNKGIEETVQVIDKEEGYVSEEKLNRCQEYYYNLTVQLKNGKKIKSTIPFSENNTKIKIGDTIKIKRYKNTFITQ